MNIRAKQIGAILLLSGVVAAVVNSIHPRKIAWVQDWSNHVESKARKNGLRMIPLSVALQKHAVGRSVFIDARSAEAFAAGHIPGAVSAPRQFVDTLFTEWATLLDSGRELIIYCQNRECDDALLLAAELQAMGASNLVLYVDGFELWQKYGGAVER